MAPHPRRLGVQNCAASGRLPLTFSNGSAANAKPGRAISPRANGSLRLQVHDALATEA
jgi:hypothetical protein